MGVETTGSRVTAKSRNRHCRRAGSLPSMASKMAAFQSKAGNEMKSWFAREFKLRRRLRLRPISWQEKSVSKPRVLRSEERRVGKECRERCEEEQYTTMG